MMRHKNRRQGRSGRLSLPLALRCGEPQTVEPSAGIASEYHSLVLEAGITNARLLPVDWMDVEGISFAVCVMYNEAKPTGGNLARWQYTRLTALT